MASRMPIASRIQGEKNTQIHGGIRATLPKMKIPFDSCWALTCFRTDGFKRMLGVHLMLGRAARAKVARVEAA